MENDKNLQPETLLDEDLDKVSGGITYDFPDPKFQVGQLVMSRNPQKWLNCLGTSGCDARTIGRVKAVRTESIIKGFIYEIECVRCGGQMAMYVRGATHGCGILELRDGTYVSLEEDLVVVS